MSQQPRHTVVHRDSRAPARLSRRLPGPSARRLPWLALLLFTLSNLACQAILPGRQVPAAPVSRPSSQWEAFAGLAGAAAAGLLPAPALTALPAPSQTATTGITSSHQESAGFSVRLHPDGGLYVGDLVSFEVIAPPGMDLQDQELVVSVAGQTLPPAPFGKFGIGGRPQATLLWSWDTRSLEPGMYEIEFSIPSAGITWNQPVVLAPASQLPLPEPGARWDSLQTDCCLIHYVSGTPAARDLPEIARIVDDQAELAVSRMGLEFTEEIEVVLLPRVLGHGGFASGEISISYLDRNYANNDLAQVLHHEMVHILDYRLGGEYRPSLFVEGLAVYLSRGHYKREPLFTRAAALPGLGLYLPLAALADDFYNSQHEVGYLQAGALIQYMVGRWGWQAFDAFYRSIPEPENEPPSAVIDRALRRSFGLSLDELEIAFLGALEGQVLNPDLEQDVLLSVRLYDTVRRYQQALDPSAYFLTAWLLNGPDMRSRNIVADYLRRPATPENLALEVMLSSAGEHLVLGQYPEARRLLAAVNAALLAVERGHSQPLEADALAAELLALVQAAVQAGYQPQRLALDAVALRDLADGKARMWASVLQDSPSGIKLVALGWQKDSGGWVLSSAN